MQIYDAYRWFTPTWKTDGGIKSDYNCWYDDHLRLYALADRDYSPILGYYVLGTNHLDRENGSCADTYWSEEVDEAWWRDRITNHLSGYGWVVHADASNWLNHESYHDAAPPGEPDHYVESNGLTTYVDVP